MFFCVLFSLCRRKLAGFLFNTFPFSVLCVEELFWCTWHGFIECE